MRDQGHLRKWRVQASGAGPPRRTYRGGGLDTCHDFARRRRSDGLESGRGPDWLHRRCAGRHGRAPRSLPLRPAEGVISRADSSCGQTTANGSDSRRTTLRVEAAPACPSEAGPGNQPTLKLAISRPLCSHRAVLCRERPRLSALPRIAPVRGAGRHASRSDSRAGEPLIMVDGVTTA